MILFWGSGEHSYLSNFHYAPFELDGIMWPTVESYFQAMKTTDSKEWVKFSELAAPWEAKLRGRSVELRPDWEQVRLDYMKKALLAKFGQHPDLATKLLATGAQDLHEDSPSDYVWGWRNNGLDLLGKCLMEVRKELSNGKETEPSCS